MDFKQISYELKDFDEKQGIVKAYANAYNFKDSDGDISAVGSFNKTVSENFKRIRVLKDHISTISLGVPLEINTNDSYGLLTTTKFNLQKEVSRDMFTDIQLLKDNGLNAELSIGYEVVKRDEKNRNIINEYKLWEYSFLSSWAANEMSIVQDVKNIKSHYGIMELLTKAYNLPYSDTRLVQIENILKMVSNQDSNKDLEFIKMMIPHHQDAIDMSEKYIPLMTDINLIALAKNIIKTQTDEIKTMKSLESTKPFEKNTLPTEPTDEQIKETLIKSFSQWK